MSLPASNGIAPVLAHSSLNTESDVGRRKEALHNDHPA